MEKDGLPACGKRAVGLLDKGLRKGAYDAAFVALARHVDDLNLGHRYVVETLCQADEGIFSCKSLVVGLDTWRCAAEQDFGAVHRRKHDSGVAAVIARSGVKLFVACLVFLVDDHQTEPCKWQKDGLPGTDDDARFIVGQQTAPDIDTLTVGKF